MSAPRKANKNPSEAAIRDKKLKWYCLKSRKNVPNRLWDFGIEYVPNTSNVTYNKSRYMQKVEHH